MSITGAISNALSGLRASSYAADVVSSNLANAMNENYAQRRTELAQDGVGQNGGVRVVGVKRTIDLTVNADWREANVMSSALSSKKSAIDRVSSSIGLSSDPSSLEGMITRFETQLVSAASRPDLQQRLTATAYAASDMVAKINDVANTIQEGRANADDRIGELVNSMNAILEDLGAINKAIVQPSLSSREKATYMDQRDQLLNELSSITEVRVLPRERDTVAVYSSGGATLLEGSVREIVFDRTGGIQPEMTLESGLLSTLSIDGVAFDAGTDGQRFFGGELGAMFDVRDKTLVSAQADIDAIAFELASRLNDPALDPTRGPGDVGFFTDGGSVVDPGNLVGLSKRLEFNETIDPQRGGDPNLMRDGILFAGVPEPGNASLLQGLVDAMSDVGSVAHGQFTGVVTSISGLTANVASQLSAAAARLEDRAVAAESKKTVLNELKSAQSVDSDIELQRLMLISQNYAANAQVMRKSDELMQTLLEVV